MQASFSQLLGVVAVGRTPVPSLQNRGDAFISAALSLEPGRICMTMLYSQIASARPKPDACVAR
jgi:hypothetical protein